MYRLMKLRPVLWLRTGKTRRAPCSLWAVLIAVSCAMTTAPGCGAISALRGTSATAKARAAAAQRALATGHTATLDLASGVDVEGQTVLPPGFVPDTEVAPMWLDNAAMVAVAGHVGPRTELIGFARADLRKAQLIVADSPPPQTSRIVALAPNPDGTMIAVVRFLPITHRTELILSTLISSGSAYRAAALEGDFDMVSLAWLGPNTVAFAPRRTVSVAGAGAPAITAPTPLVGTQTPAANNDIYVINVSGSSPSARLSIDCTLSALSWSPDGSFAVGQGDSRSNPVLIDRNTGSCRKLPVGGPIRVLGWFQKRFLYSALNPVNRIPAVFYYDAETGHGGLVAVSSTAAAWSSAGTAVALGSQQVTWQSAVRTPDAPVPADVATLSLAPYYVNVKSLAVQTVPLLLAQSTMDYTLATDTAAVGLYAPGPVAPLHWMFLYSVPAGVVVPLGSGRAGGPIATSWSPDGKALAIVDGNNRLWALTIIRQPRFGAMPPRAAADLRAQSRAAS